MLERIKKASETVMPHIFSKKNIPNLGSMFIFTASSIALNLFAAYTLKKIIGMIALGQEIVSFELLGDIEFSLGEVITIYVGGIVISKFFQTSRKLVVSPIISEAAYGIVYEVNKHLINLSQSYFSKAPMGSLSEMFTTGSMGAADFSGQLLNQVIPVTMEGATAIGVAGYLYGPYPPIAFCSMFGVYLAYNTIMAKYIAENQKALVSAKSMMTRKVTSMLMNYETIHYYNNSPYELNKIKRVLDEVKSINTQGIGLPDKIAYGQWIIIGGGFVTLMLLLENRPINEFVAINFYLLQFLNLFNGFGDGVNKLRAAMINLEEVANVFSKKPDVPDYFPDTILQQPAKNRTVISFDNVFFGYNNTQMILQGVSFNVIQGQKIGIIGLTGGGKSTIAKLLYRFYDASQGSIKINGQDIKTIGLVHLRSKIAVVPQTPTMFNDSLKNNIWYGAIAEQGEEADDETLRMVISQASLQDYIESLPKKLETSVGERGLKISGGQLQRIAIARAILKDPDIYIFDEATSALDTKTEIAIQKNLDEIVKGKTAIIISHKLYNVKDADNIIVLSKGCKIEEGNHEQLLEKNGLYAELWNKQSQEYAPSEKPSMSSLPMLPKLEGDIDGSAAELIPLKHFSKPTKNVNFYQLPTTSTNTSIRSDPDVDIEICNTKDDDEEKSRMSINYFRKKK